MNKNILLSGDYLYKATPWLIWGEVLYGFNHGFVTEKSIVEYAFLRLNEKSSQDEIELASLSDSELYQAADILKRLANDNDAHDTSLESWLYLLLSWVYEHRDSFADPFVVVEELYSDFNYQEDIASVVRYMPIPDGETGGDEYLYNNWRRVISLYKHRLEEVHGSSS